MSEKKKTVSVYREQGDDPKGVTVGGYTLGVVHHGVSEEVAAVLTRKQFQIVPPNFDPKKQQKSDQKGENGATSPPAEASAIAEPTK